MTSSTYFIAMSRNNIANRNSESFIAHTIFDKIISRAMTYPFYRNALIGLPGKNHQENIDALPFDVLENFQTIATGQ